MATIDRLVFVGMPFVGAGGSNPLINAVRALRGARDPVPKLKSLWIVV
ncbi:hypothetical protein BSU04_32045 [Caballeronia sordidicola]|uniref:Uncharacterized protein n=1 Tax=Caballeronia sordidicola TaxID=196367 RepID=A0A226WU99_CABSO|nr:hypothetical protein BSU04_32045 [Caballeronia sordidicola]